MTHDNTTEFLRTINIIERFNIHQEVILGIIYRSFSQSLKVWVKYIFLLEKIHSPYPFQFDCISLKNQYKNCLLFLENAKMTNFEN